LEICWLPGELFYSLCLVEPSGVMSGVRRQSRRWVRAYTTPECTLLNGPTFSGRVRSKCCYTFPKISEYIKLAAAVAFFYDKAMTRRKVWC
jgi:hypothetical protein